MSDSTPHKHRFNLAEFDYWAHIAVVDPGAFEAHRSRVIDAFIDSVPIERQPRLRGLQWRIDQVRRTSRTPLAACIRISRMMWDSVLGTGGLHEVLNIALHGGSTPAKAPVVPHSAQVLPFHGRGRTGH